MKDEKSRCVYCQKQIGELVSPCPHCGKEIEWLGEKELAFSENLKRMGYRSFHKTENGYSVDRMRWYFKKWTIELDKNFKIVSMKTSFNYGTLVTIAIFTGLWGGLILIGWALLGSNSAIEKMRIELSEAVKQA